MKNTTHVASTANPIDGRFTHPYKLENWLAERHRDAEHHGPVSEEWTTKPRTYGAGSKLYKEHFMPRVPDKGNVEASCVAIGRRFGCRGCANKNCTVIDHLLSKEWVEKREKWDNCDARLNQLNQPTS